jgi:hypothetical protein
MAVSSQMAVGHKISAHTYITIHTKYACAITEKTTLNHQKCLLLKKIVTMTSSILKQFKVGKKKNQCHIHYQMYYYLPIHIQ